MSLAQLDGWVRVARALLPGFVVGFLIGTLLARAWGWWRR